MEAPLLPADIRVSLVRDTQEIDSSIQKAPVFRTYASRFWMLFLFSMCSLISAVMWISLAPIQTTASSAFGVSSTAINSISMIFLITYAPSSLLCLFTLDAWGLRATLMGGAACNLVGTLLRFIGCLLLDTPNAAFACIVLGQLAGGIGQPLILNIPTRISADWFSDKERDVATVTATMANILGQMIGSLAPAYVVTTADDLKWLMLPQACAALVVGALCFTLSERPPTPPSAAAAQQWQLADDLGRERKGTAWAAVVAMWADVKTLMKIPSFLWMMFGFSVATGMSWALLTLQAQVIQPCGYSDDIAGASGASLLGAGIVASYALAYVMERTKAYFLLQKVIMVTAVGATAFALAVNKPNSAALVLVAWCFLGATLSPLLPVTLEAAAEMTYPLPADTSATVLLIMANIIGTILTYVLGALLELPVSTECTSIFTPAAYVVMAFMGVGAVGIMPLKGAFKRQEASRR